MFNIDVRKRKTDRVNGGEVKSYSMKDIEAVEQREGYAPLSNKTATYEDRLEVSLSEREAIHETVRIYNV